MLRADWRCSSVSAESRSARPSASDRSIRPLAKARRVNSPGSAARRPGIAASTAKTAFTTPRPPCRWSSAVSSPVAVFGPGSHSTSARSSRLPASSCSVAATALRSTGNRPHTVRKASPAADPLTRTTAIAAGGAPLERANIVSVMVSQPAQYAGLILRLLLGTCSKGRAVLYKLLEQL